jgi:hypothetical protein
MKVETKAELRRIIKASSERITDLEAMLLGALEDNNKLKTRLVISIVGNLFLALLLALRFGVVSL